MTSRGLEQLKQLCNDAGIKLTHQRLEIFRELLSSNDHPSAEIIYQRLHKKLPTIAIDTVYRTLATFDELGLVRKLHIMNERTLFDTNLDIHHHFICTRCRKVEDIYWPDFDKAMLPESTEKMGKIQSRHLEMLGICNECLSKQENQD
ncbi:MAG TPA: transcriptional repressor [Desulfocapsa sulfexigens]|nr:transcriptional repressor [Desulfocapsa sulfexigens]